MDAEYYFSGGRQLASGQGFNEPFLWNYLDDPQGLPHPSHAYWMPLASILAAAGLVLGGTADFAAGRWIFILVAACLPPLSAALSYRLNQRSEAAWLSGLLAVFPVFYLAYLPTSDTFGLYMLLGGLWLLAAQSPVKAPSLRGVDIAPFVMGTLSGLMHLTRADGILWLALALLAVLVIPQPEGDRTWRGRLGRLASCIAGYGLVMAPWLLRNLGVFGSPLSPGNNKALWFVDYDDLYAFPGSLITPSRWWESGVVAIAQARLWAAGQNLVTALVVQGDIFLSPLIVVGLWRLRGIRSVRFGTLAWALSLALMSLVFPFAGARGGFYHSGAAVQTLIWAAAPAGLWAFVEWGERRRGWRVVQAWRVFRAGILVLVIAMTAVIFQRRVLGSDWRHPAWAQSQAAYIELAGALEEMGIQAGDLVMVNNPPGLFLASGMPSIPIPDGDVGTLLAAARQYGAKYVLLEANHPQELDDLYQNPGERPGLHLLRTYMGVFIFEVLEEQGTAEVAGG